MISVSSIFLGSLGLKLHCLLSLSCCSAQYMLKILIIPAAADSEHSWWCVNDRVLKMFSVTDANTSALRCYSLLPPSKTEECSTSGYTVEFLFSFSFLFLLSIIYFSNLALPSFNNGRDVSVYPVVRVRLGRIWVSESERLLLSGSTRLSSRWTTECLKFFIFRVNFKLQTRRLYSKLY